MSIQDILTELREDHTHGASWYFKRGIDLIKQAMSELGPDGVRSIINELRSVRPGMASLSTLIYVIEQALARGLDLNDVINRLERRYEEARSALLAQLDRHAVRCGSVAVTISYSQAVATALSRWGKCLEGLLIMESRPGDEVVEAVRAYSKFVGSVKPIPDSSIAHFIESYGVNYAVVGADGLYSDGYFLNKVGTKTLLIVARRYDVETVVVAESYKAAVGGAGDVYRVSVNIGGVATELPLFDAVPLDLVDYLITDVGIFRKPRPEDVEEVRRLFIEGVLGG